MPSSPCDPSPDYILAQCVEEYIVGQAGCQPPWRRFTFVEIPLCDNWTLLTQYSHEKTRVLSDMTRDELLDTSKCLLPCSFIEYKVNEVNSKEFY